VNETSLIAGRYRITGLLGRGMFTDVFKADDTVLDRKVALKVLKLELSRDPRIVERFTQDARFSTELVHENIAHVLDVGLTRFDDAPEVDRPFVIVERVTGLTLTDLLARGPLKPAEACRIAGNILAALDVAHRRGIIHQGITPNNVLISTSGVAKLSDVGLSAGVRIVAGLSVAQEAVEWRAPELATGATADVRADLFSVGVVLFAMLTGRVPFPGGYTGIRAPMASSLNDRIPVALNLVVARALEPQPASRYATAADFLADLATALSALEGTEDFEPIPPVVPAPVAPVPPPAPVPSAELAAASGPLTSQMVAERSGIDLPPTERMDSVAQTETDKLIMLFGRNAVSDNAEFEASLPQKRRQRSRIVLGLIVSLVFVVAISMVTLWVLNIKPVDFFPSSARSVPNVVGFTYTKAAAELTQAGLTPVRVDEPNATVPLGAVIRIDPDANRQVDIGARITVYVSSGLAEVTIPNVAGMTVEQATDELKKLGLVIGTNARGNSATIPQGLVVATTPVAGAMSKTGVTVDLVVSSGEVTIPDLTGMTVDAAAGILGGADISITPSLQADTSCRVGADGVIVTSQSVAPGDIPAGTPITLTYCAG
jgi:beta-lactam-binding protein with PASTA domain/tRNA A-37 threonylcarbamoyl transferase component Bud32